MSPVRLGGDVQTVLDVVGEAHEEGLDELVVVARGAQVVRGIVGLGVRRGGVGVAHAAWRLDKHLEAAEQVHGDRRAQIRANSHTSKQNQPIKLPLTMLATWFHAY